MNKDKIKLINKALHDLNNDSVKIIKFSQEYLDKLGGKYFSELYKIYKKYNSTDYFREFRGDSEYVQFDSKEKNLLYFYLSAKYADCSENKEISIEELSEFNFTTIEYKIKQKRIEHIKRQKIHLELSLKKYNDELKEYES